jgi:hypothetical protein
LNYRHKNSILYIKITVFTILSRKNETNFTNMIFKGDCLRVVSPVTEDGNRPKIDPDSGLPVYKETFLPVTARKQLDIQNRRLPAHLRKKIELVSPSPDEALPIANKANPVERKKPGPKPKAHAA